MAPQTETVCPEVELSSLKELVHSLRATIEGLVTDRDCLVAEISALKEYLQERDKIDVVKGNDVAQPNRSDPSNDSEIPFVTVNSKKKRKNHLNTSSGPQPVITHNRFNTLVDLVDPENEDDSTSQGTLDVTKRKRRVFIVGASQAQRLSKPLSDSLPNDEVCVFSRPGASLETVMDIAEEVVVQNAMNKDDWMVVIGGSSDIGQRRRRYDSNVFRSLASKVNLAVAEVPRRWDLPPIYADDVSRFNYALQRDVSDAGGLFMAVKAERRHFTTHGLHYNLSGKYKLASTISKMIQNSPFLEI